MLEIRDLDAYYGKSHVIRGVSLTVSRGEVIGILGRNGVGKTTLLRSILGLEPPKRIGSIRFDGTDIGSTHSHLIARLGIGYVPQGRRIFPRLTVLENLTLPVIKGKAEQKDLHRVFEYFPVLEDRSEQLGQTLSGGEQQMLAMGRAIMSRPKLLVVDEPTEGLQPSMVNIVRKSIKTLLEQGTTALIADQNLENALELCDRVYVLEKGAVRYQEKKSNLSMNLLRRYLGVTTADPCIP